MHFKLTRDGQQLEFTRADGIDPAMQFCQWGTHGFRLARASTLNQSTHSHFTLRKESGVVFTKEDIEKVHKLISRAASVLDIVIDPDAGKELARKLDAGLIYARSDSDSKSIPAVRVRMDAIGLWHPGHRPPAAAPKAS